MQTNGCLKTRAGGKIMIMDYRGTLKLKGVMKMFVTLIAKMVLQMCL